MIALTTTYTARDIREPAALHVGCVQKEYTSNRKVLLLHFKVNELRDSENTRVISEGSYHSLFISDYIARSNCCFHHSSEPHF